MYMLSLLGPSASDHIFPKLQIPDGCARMTQLSSFCFPKSCFVVHLNYQTLERVISLQESIKDVGKELQSITSLIQINICKTDEAKYSDIVVRLNALWIRYADDTRSDGILRILRDNLQRAEKDGWVGLPPESLNKINLWADLVLNGAGGIYDVYTDLDSLNNFLLNGAFGGSIATCSQAVLSLFQDPKTLKNSPLDDRQYYEPMLTWLIDKVVIQTQAVQMMSEAYLWKAQNAAMQRAQQMKVNLTLDLLTSGDFCTQVVAAPVTSPLAAALDACQDAIATSSKIYNNIIAQLEYLGAPYSEGRAAGEGVRLLIGTNVMGVQGKAIINPNGEESDQKLQPYNVNTTWLFAASVQAFDSRCNSRLVENAYKGACAAVGTFKSCGSGCGLDPVQEGRWRGLYYPLGYPSDAWFPATYEPWRDLRGMISGSCSEGVHATNFILPFLPVSVEMQLS